MTVPLPKTAPLVAVVDASGAATTTLGTSEIVVVPGVTLG